MKFFHLSDLHLGKRVNGFSMIEDQKYILQQITELADREAPDAVIIAGDVYDKSIPSVEAVNLFDDFLVSLAQKSQVLSSAKYDSAGASPTVDASSEQSGIHISRRIIGGGSTSSSGSGEYSGSDGFASFENPAENLSASSLSVSSSSGGTDPGKISIVRLEDEYGAFVP